MFQIYSSRKGPQPLGTVDYYEIEEKARQVLKDNRGMLLASTTINSEYDVLPLKGAFLYINGSAGTSSTYRANLRAFEKFAIIPRMLVNATERNLEVIKKVFQVPGYCSFTRVIMIEDDDLWC